MLQLMTKKGQWPRLTSHHPQVKLRQQLALTPLSEVWRRTRPLLGLRGSVLPSEAFLFHSLAELQGAGVWSLELG